jgi:hypothetical protein
MNGKIVLGTSLILFAIALFFLVPILLSPLFFPNDLIDPRTGLYRDASVFLIMQSRGNSLMLVDWGIVISVALIGLVYLVLGFKDYSNMLYQETIGGRRVAKIQLSTDVADGNTDNIYVGIVVIFVGIFSIVPIAVMSPPFLTNIFNILGVILVIVGAIFLIFGTTGYVKTRDGIRCQKCGNSISSKHKHCPNCGTINEEDAEFCKKCANKLGPVKEK